MVEQSREVHLLVPVWGDAYIQHFLDWSLPTQLADHNLPYLAQQAQAVHYHIVTDINAKQWSSPVLEQLTQYAQLHWHDLQPLRQKIGTQRSLWRRYTDQDWQKYALKLACLQQGLDIAHQTQGIFIPLMSDLLMANGTFSYLWQQIKAQKQCVLISGPRVTAQSFLPSLEYFRDTQKIDIPGQQLVDLCVEHLHPSMHQHSHHSPSFNTHWVDYLFWQSESMICIQQGVFAYPLLFDCQQSIQLEVGETIDLCALPFFESDYHVVTQPAQCMVVTPSNHDELLPSTELSVFDPMAIALFLQQHAKPQHLYFSQHAIQFIHSQADNNKVKQLNAECRSDWQQINTCYQLCQQFPDIALRLWRSQLVYRYRSLWHKTMVETILQLTQPYARLAVFGSGQEYQLLLALNIITHKICVVLDNNPQQQSITAQPAPIISPEQVIDYPPVVLLLSITHHQAMQQQLQQLNQSIEVLNPYVY